MKCGNRAKEDEEAKRSTGGRLEKPTDVTEGERCFAVFERVGALQSSFVRQSKRATECSILERSGNQRDEGRVSGGAGTPLQLVEEIEGGYRLECATEEKKREG